MDNPRWLVFGSGLGNIHNLSADYIPPDQLYYMQDRIIVAKSGYLRQFSELGVVGFVLFSLANFAVYRRLGFCLKLNSQQIDKQCIKAIRLILVVVTIMYLARGYAFVIYILFFSIINSWAYWEGFYNREKTE